MIQVRRRRFWEPLLEDGASEPWLRSSLVALYYWKRRFFGKIMGASFLVLLCFLQFYSHRGGLVLLQAMGLYLLFLRYRTDKIASAISIRRSAPAEAHEGETISIRYQISNGSSFVLDDCFVIDSFTGSHSGNLKMSLDKLMSPGGKQIIQRTVTCDAGMGDHVFGPLKCLVSDPFGFFEYEIIDDGTTPIFVYPRVEAIPHIPLRGCRDSFVDGVYEIKERGGSSNFMGIREYHPGDPIKFISWRMTARHGRLLIKEFEKAANTEIAILMDMDERFHAGEGAKSTWECARDLTLSLVTQQSALGNSIQVLSQKTFMPLGRGETHSQYITLKMPKVKPASSEENLVDFYWDLISPNSTVFYVGAYFSDEVPPTVKSLPKLLSRGIQVICVLMDGDSYVKGKIPGVLETVRNVNAWLREGPTREIFKALAASEIPTYVVHNEDRLGTALLKSQTGGVR